MRKRKLSSKEAAAVTAVSVRINAKEREKKERKVRIVKKMKGIDAERVKYSTAFQATDALIGDEEQNGKQKRTKRKKQGAGPQPIYSVPFTLLRSAGIIR